MDILRWAIGLAFTGVFLLLLVCHSWIIWETVVLRKRSSSPGFFLGSLCGVIGFLVVPVPSLHRYWWLPLIADLTTPVGIGGLLYVCYLWLRESRKGKGV